MTLQLAQSGVRESRDDSDGLLLLLLPENRILSTICHLAQRYFLETSFPRERSLCKQSNLLIQLPLPSKFKQLLMLLLASVAVLRLMNCK